VSFADRFSDAVHAAEKERLQSRTAVERRILQHVTIIIATIDGEGIVQGITMITMMG
jgi:hypothetical protein